MYFTLYLYMDEAYGHVLRHIFLQNHPNYIIDFIFSKDLPFRNNLPDFATQKLSSRDFRGNAPIFICDRDDSLAQLTVAYPEIPVIAISHEGNPSEELVGVPWLLLSFDALTPDLLEEVFCRHNQLPLRIGQTDRLTLRELTGQDLPALLALQAENASNPDGCFFPADCPDPDAFLSQYIHTQYSFFGFGIYGVFDRARDTFLGVAGLNTDGIELLTEKGDAAWVSYGLLRQYHRQGYASEAVSLLMAEGRRRWEFTRFAARIHRDNLPSVRTAKHCHLEICLYDS